ncbi:MAG: lamin tail domain-containing protein, partial [Actinobacteria bacterium]|nr:lamin tail domain-containing protein [Actinomycetota bacterium]
MAGHVGTADGRIQRGCPGAFRAAILGVSLAIAAGSSLLVLATDLAPGGAVVLSEIQYNPPPGLGSDELYEYVELHNRGADPVDVSGWRLKDQDDDHAFGIPEGTVIPADGYLVVARDAAALRAAYPRELAVVGDLDFALGNDGDTVRLMNARGELIDRVEYADGIPWPPEADGEGSSLERVSAVDDITDFTNFLASRAGSPPGTPGALNSRAGEIPARHDVVFSEIMYHPVKDPDAETRQHCVADEYLELHNRGPSPVDISGWRIADGVDFAFPEGTVLAAGGHVVIYSDETAFREAYGEVPGSIGPYTKELDDGGEALLLVDRGGAPVDYVRYDDSPPWPVNPDGLRGSLELVDAAGDNDRAQAWRESDGFQGTPGRKNSATIRFDAGVGGAPPQITGVSARPVLDREREHILSADEVEVKARVYDRDGIASARLEYQVVAPGDYISRTDPRFETEWTSLEMSYRGDRGTYAAVLPALPHRTLVRYRILATDAATTPAETWAPFQRDPEPNFGYYVYDGVPDYVASRRSGFGDPGFRHAHLEKVPVYHILMDRGDFDDVMYVERDPADNTYGWQV